VISVCDYDLREKLTFRVVLIVRHVMWDTYRSIGHLKSPGFSYPSLSLRQPLQDRLDVILSILYKFDCVSLRKCTMSAKTDSLICPFLSSFVAKARVESSSNIILNTISSIVGVGMGRVYVSTRMRQRSMDSSK
jgi:hypothetical protein